MYVFMSPQGLKARSEDKSYISSGLSQGGGTSSAVTPELADEPRRAQSRCCQEVCCSRSTSMVICKKASDAHQSCRH